MYPADTLQLPMSGQVDLSCFQQTLCSFLQEPDKADGISNICT